jgi:hypothetical protein
MSGGFSRNRDEPTDFTPNWRKNGPGLRTKITAKKRSQKDQARVEDGPVTEKRWTSDKKGAVGRLVRA